MMVSPERITAAPAHGTERWIVIHSHSPILDWSRDDNMAHCFGPFESFAEAAGFEAEKPDGCYVFALPLVGPATSDVLRSAHR